MSDRGAAKRPAEQDGESTPGKRARLGNGTHSSSTNGPAHGSAAASNKPKVAINKEAIENAKRLLAERKAALSRKASAAGMSAPTLPAGASASADVAPAALRPPLAAPGIRPPAPLAVPGVRPAMRPSAVPMGPVALRLDEQGREVDEHGNLVQRQAEIVTTFKVNLKRPELLRRIVPEEDDKPKAESFYDAAIGKRGARKQERKSRAAFSFVRPGQYDKQAQEMRIRAEYGEEGVRQLRQRQAEERRSAAEGGDANLVPLGQRVSAAEAQAGPTAEEPIPDVEWWDARILRNPASYEEPPTGSWINEARITLYVDHPVPIEPVVKEAPAAPMPLMLTPRERKKMKTQRRLEREKEKQDLIAQGLLEPPKPKVRLANMVRVLGEQATLDPTAIEMEVRAQAQERQQAHEDRNLARQLTPAERRDKKLKRLVGHANEGKAPLVAVYRVRDLSNKQHQFKVKVNAEELHMSGCAVLTDELCVIVTEGGPKAQKKYSKLMLQRINWDQRPEADEEQPDRPPNRCDLVWQGMVQVKAFKGFVIEACRSEVAALKFFRDRNLSHYWQLAATAEAANA